MTLRTPILALLLLGGCAAVPSHPPQPPVARTATISGVSLNRSLDEALVRWEVEIAPLHPDAVLFVCHGGPDPKSGAWTCYPDPPGEPAPVETMAMTLVRLYPGRPVYIIVCNRNASNLRSPAYYPIDRVWTWPDRQHPPAWMRDKGMTGVGAVEEFVRGGG